MSDPSGRTGRESTPTVVDPRRTAGVPQRAEDRDHLPQWFAMAGMAAVTMNGVRIAGWTVSDLCFLAAGLAIAASLLTGSRQGIAPVATRRSSPAVLIGLLLLSLGALLATVGRSLDAGTSALAVARVWYITIVWFWVVRSVATSIRTFRRLLLAAVVGAVFHALIAIFQDVTGLNGGPPTWGRSVGWADHFNDLGLALGSMMPVLVVWRPERENGRHSDLLRLGGMVVLLGGVAATGSIGGTGAAIIGTIVALVLSKSGGRRRSKRSSLPILVAGLAILAVTSGVVDLPVQSRFEDLLAGDSPTASSAASRGEHVEVAIAGIVSSPLVGVGLDKESSSIDGPDTQVHNFYLRLTYEAGVLGILGLGVILGITGVQIRQLHRHTRGRPLAWMPAALGGALVVVLLDALFEPYLYQRIAWLPIALTSALYGVARAGWLARDSAETPPPQHRTAG